MTVVLRAVRQVLRGEPGDLPLSAVSVAARVMIVAALMATNLGGAAVVVVLLGFVLPVPDAAGGRQLEDLAIGGGYTLAALVIGTRRGLRLAKPVIVMFERNRDPSEAERRAVLRLPVTVVRVQFALWGGAVVLLGGIACTVSVLYGFEVAATLALTALATGALSYLVTQRLLRGGVDVALAEAPPRRREVPGVGARVVFFWGLSTAVPVAGALALGLVALTTDLVERDELARSTIALSGVALAVGLLAMVVFARSLSDPLRRLRDAFAQVEGGDLDTRVRIFDATEVGYASAGFNRMVEGLRERERLRDLFGRQVGADVARQALEQGVTLGGEEREAAALFVDVIGSTRVRARPQADRGGGGSQPVLRDRRRGHAEARRTGQQVRGRCGAVRLRRAAGDRGPGGKRARGRARDVRTPVRRRPRGRDRRVRRDGGGGERRDRRPL